VVDFFLHIYDFFHARLRLCMAFLTVLTVGLLLMLSSLQYNENIYDFLPVSGNEQKAITLYQDITGGQSIYAMFSMKDGDSTATARLAEAVDTFEQQLTSGYGKRHIREVTTQVDFDKVASITDFIYQHMPVMLTDSDYVRMEKQLASPDFVKEQLTGDVQMMMVPATGFFSTSIGNDPLGLFSSVMLRLQDRQRNMPFEMDDGYLFTPGMHYALAMITSPYGSMESANNSSLVNYVDSVSMQTMKSVPDVEVALTGSPVIAVGNAKQIKTDSQWAISIAVTLILTLLVFAFRKVRNLMLIGVSIAFGWLFAMAFIAVLRSDVSLIVLGIGSVIIGIAVNYPLHFIAHTDHGETMREVLKEMVPPLLIGNITTVGAFASLMPLDAPALRDLGFFAAFMLVGTILFVLVFLPHLVRKRVAEKKERLPFGKIASVSVERHRWLLWAMLVLTCVFGYFSLGISFDTNMHNINYMTERQKSLLGDLRESAGVNDTANIYVVTEGDTWDEALSRHTRVVPLFDSLMQVGCIKKYTDVTAFVCSKEEQQRRIGLWNDFWNKHRSDICAQLEREAPGLGFSEDAFANFLDIINKEYSPYPFEHFEPVQSVLLGNSFSNSTGKCSVVDVIEVGDGTLDHIEKTIEETIGSDGYAFDFVGMNSAIAKSLSDDFNYIGLACGLIVFIFLWLSFGRLELSLLAFLPMAMGWLWILGIMSLLGMQFNIVNVILATFIFGQGDDYTIFITDGLINEYAYKKRLLPSFKNSIVISALVMFIGIGSLIVAKHPALHSLAEVTIVGMICVVLMAWVVPPLVFDWMTRTNGQTRRRPVTIEQLVRTSYCTLVYLFELAYGCIAGFIARMIPGKSDKPGGWFHRLINKSMRANINHIWGVKSVLHNDAGEDFSKGSIIICNHQSILDPVYMLAMNPRVLILVSGKVWKNPFVHTLFKFARFINLDQPMDSLKDRIAKAVNEGYSVVVFPEGKRNVENITRFHKGAFYIAQEIGADILPVFIHGAGYVMPKGSGFASRGRIDVEIGKRIPASRLHEYGSTHQEIANRFHQMYLQHFAQMRKSIADSHYFHHEVIYKYTYKGFGLEKETRRLLKQYDDFSKWIDGYQPEEPSSNEVDIINAGNGQFSLLFALVHPEMEVYSYHNQPDEVLLASTFSPMPANLHVVPLDGGGEEGSMPCRGNQINLAEIIS